MRSGGLRQELGQSHRRSQLSRGQVSELDEGAIERRAGQVEISAEHGDAGHPQQRGDAGGVLRQLGRPAIVRGGQITLLNRDFGDKGLNRGQLTVLRQELLRDLGRFLQLTQLQERASEAGTGAGRGKGGEATLPAGADARGVAKCEREGSPLVQKRGRLARLLLDKIKQLPGVVELTADTEPRRELVAELRRQRACFEERGPGFVNGHWGAVPDAGDRLAGALHAYSP
jgi:hypothetical protein